MRSRYAGMMLKGNDFFVTTATAPPPALVLAALPSGPVSRDSTYHRAVRRSADERARDRVWVTVAVVAVALGVVAAIGIWSAIRLAPTA
jgi:hypothetical protein